MISLKITPYSRGRAKVCFLSRRRSWEKKKLGVLDTYKKHPYLIQSAIDYEVCLRSDVFVGNTFSTFSSLIVLDRTQLMISKGLTQQCGLDVRWPSYAYNLEGELNGPRPWAANMSDDAVFDKFGGKPSTPFCRWHEVHDFGLVYLQC
ncbi:O-fucosyltransferase 23-like [Salvia miltiorrhiza]|uniref:O-fucosyltransferase 23-like n=1 Tax=Salvia miltiorrhiza TaxID=226208 RepID=UPI0025AC31A4|nr:O-fucosyltransferase 23-like [Salvia miltiorrhiza]